MGEPAAVPVEGRVCGRTGLWLVPLPEHDLYRIARSAYSPVKPPLREADGDIAEWNRFDLPNRRTLYAASSAKGAFAECMAELRPGLGSIPFHDIFPDVNEGEDVVAQEWAQHGFMLPGLIAKQWRVDRCKALIRCTQGWCVDINDVHSLSAVRQNLGPHLARLGCQDVDGGVVRTEDRRVTVTIATWLFRQVLDDGSEPMGIRYNSRHSDAWDCWAVWSGHDGKVPARLLSKGPIELHDPDFQAVCRLWGLRPF